MNIWNFFGKGTSTEILPAQYKQGPTFNSIGYEELAEIARQLLHGLARMSHAPDTPPCGLLTISVGGLSQLMNAIPGLRTLDADAMNPTDVERLALYVRTRLPALFDEVVDGLATQWPDAAAVLEESVPSAELSPVLQAN